MKKKVLAVLVAGCMLALCACGGKKIEGGEGNKTEASAQASATGGYTFTSNGATIVIDAAAADTIAKLGTPIEQYEAPSCAFGDLDKVWTYSGFRVDTYQIDGVDYFLDVVFTDDSVATAEGVRVGDSLDAVKSAYGEPTTVDSTQAVYEKDQMKLTFLLNGDSVKSIQYLSKKLDK